MRNRSPNQINLVLIRHGATISNAEHRYLGRRDEPLSVEGIQALQDAKEAQRYPKVEVLFVSPMKRCLETAGILYPEMEPVAIAEWPEMDFGAFEGKNYQDLQGDVQYQAWIDSNGTLPFPEGESREEFVNRCCVGLDSALVYLGKIQCEVLPGKTSRRAVSLKDEVPTIGAIVHGGTIMALFSRYGDGAYFDYQVTNGGGYQCRVEFGHGGIRILDIKDL